MINRECFISRFGDYSVWRPVEFLAGNMNPSKTVVEGALEDELEKAAAAGVVEFKEHEEVMTILSSLPEICGKQVAEETTYERFLCE